jgi:hypothetical protein
MRQRSQLTRLCMALALPLLLILGSGVGARPELADSANCVYLPMVSKAMGGGLALGVQEASSPRCPTGPADRRGGGDPQ